MPDGAALPGWRLSHPDPRMTRGGGEELRRRLTLGCGGCRHDGVQGGTATLRLRIINGGAQTVEAQCDRCYGSVTGAMPKAEHPEHRTYAHWDEEARTRFREGQERTWELARAARAQLAEQGIQARARDLREKREAYRDWTGDDPQWKRLATLVRKRAGNTCEACLEAPVEAVHHVTYAFGKLPPAFLLRAVCRTCHDRLHADRRGEQDEWCPASKRGEE